VWGGRRGYSSGTGKKKPTEGDLGKERGQKLLDHIIDEGEGKEQKRKERGVPLRKKKIRRKQEENCWGRKEKEAIKKKKKFLIERRGLFLHQGKGAKGKLERRGKTNEIGRGGVTRGRRGSLKGLLSGRKSHAVKNSPPQEETVLTERRRKNGEEREKEN